MEVEKTPLVREIAKILDATELRVAYTYYGGVHVMGTDITVQAYKILAVDYIRKYQESYADECFVELTLLRGTYGFKVFPYKENLEFTLYKKPLYSNADVIATRYRAVVVDDVNPLDGNSRANKMTEDEINRMEMLTIKLQLIPKFIYTLKTAELGTVYKKAKVKDVILTTLGKVCEQIETDETNRILGIDVVEPDNQEEYSDLVISHGIRAYDVPNYLQHKVCGVYTNGIGHYIQDQHWYVYPIYDKGRSDANVRFLNIINVTSERWLGVDKTYRTEGEDVYILGTVGAKQKRDKLIDQLNYGNGIRFNNPNTIQDAISLEKTDNKAKINRTLRNTEIISEPLASGDVFAPTSADTITSNTFKQISKMNSRNGNMVSCVWDNSNMDLIKPGMMVNYFYSDSEGVTQQVKGCIIQVQHLISHVNPTALGENYQSSTAIFMFLEDFEI